MRESSTLQELQLEHLHHALHLLYPTHKAFILQKPTSTSRVYYHFINAPSFRIRKGVFMNGTISLMLRYLLLQVVQGPAAAILHLTVVPVWCYNPCMAPLRRLSDLNEAIHTSPLPLSPCLACDAGTLLSLPPSPLFKSH